MPDIPAAIKVKLKFAYDYLGRRIKKEVYGWNNVYSPTHQTVLKFIYDGWNLVAELDGRDKQVRSCVWGSDLAVMNQDRCLFMQSWHELAEQNPKLVATSRGLESLGGRSKEQVLAAQPKEYQQYRLKWSEIKKQILDLVPTKGILRNELHFRKTFRKQ